MDADPLASMESVADWSRVFRLPAVWWPLVNAALVRHGHRAAERAELLPGEIAGTHAVFAVRGELVVKIYAPFWQADYGREVGVLRQLAGRSCLAGQVALPQLAGAGELPCDTAGGGGRAWPYVITTFVPGTALGQVWEQMDRQERDRLATELGNSLAQLHNLPLPPGGDCVSRDPGASAGGDQVRRSAYWRDEWERFVAVQIKQVQQRHREWGDLPEHLIADLPSFFVRLAGFPVAGWQPALLSADVTAEHVLVAKRRGSWRIAGLIDFGDAMIGDPEYEFVVAYLAALGLDRDAFDALLAGYRYRHAADPSLWRRLFAYALLHVYPLLRAVPDLRRSAIAAAADLDAATEAFWGTAERPDQPPGVTYC